MKQGQHSVSAEMASIHLENALASKDAPAALGHFYEARCSLDAAIVAAVSDARRAGTSWQDIATPLGMTKQGAQQRYGR